MIAIVTAMKEESEILVKKYNLKTYKKFKNWTVFKWKLHKNEILLAFSGIGKIQCAMATTWILENFWEKITKLINIGIAGNTGKTSAKIGDVFLPKKFWQSDMYLPFDGSHLDYAKKSIEITPKISEKTFKNFTLHTEGTCATADRFVDNEAEIEDLKNRFEADVCEMEAFAFLSVAREYYVLEKCICIKSISDGADSDAQEVHMNNLEFAMKNGVEVLEKVLEV